MPNRWAPFERASWWYIILGPAYRSAVDRGTTGAEVSRTGLHPSRLFLVLVCTSQFPDLTARACFCAVNLVISRRASCGTLLNPAITAYVAPIVDQRGRGLLLLLLLAASSLAVERVGQLPRCRKLNVMLRHILLQQSRGQARHKRCGQIGNMSPGPGHRLARATGTWEKQISHQSVESGVGNV